MKTIKEFQQKYIRNYDDKLIDALHKEIYHLQQELTDYKEKLAKADSMLQSEIFYGKELSSRELLNMLKDYKERNEKAIKYLVWFKTDNSEFFKKKNIGLTVAEVDGLLEILDKKDKE